MNLETINYGNSDHIYPDNTLPPHVELWWNCMNESNDGNLPGYLPPHVGLKLYCMSKDYNIKEPTPGTLENLLAQRDQILNQ